MKGSIVTRSVVTRSIATRSIVTRGLLLALLFAVLQFDGTILMLARQSEAVRAARWNPIFAFEVLGLGPPGAEWARAVHLVLLASIVSAVVGFRTRVSALVAGWLERYRAYWPARMTALSDLLKDMR